MEYMSTQEAAERWGISLRYVQRLLKEGRIPGAKKYGVSWLLPQGCEKPQDLRKQGASAVLPESEAVFFPMMYLSSGEIEQAHRRCHSREERLLFDAQLACFRSQPERALELAQLVENAGAEPALRLGCKMVTALVAMSLGDASMWSEALSELEKMELPESLERERELALAMLNGGMHGKNICPGWLEQGDFEGLPHKLFPLARYVYVKNLYIKHKYLDIPAVAEPLISECRRENIDLAEIYLRIIAAVSYFNLGRLEPARRHLEKAADLALPAGILSPFIEYRQLLPQIMDECLKKNYPEELLLINKRMRPFWDSWTKTYNELWKAPIAMGLTPREWEAGQLASGGLTVGAIALRMGISKNSVKKYLNVVYQKLGIEKKSELRTYFRV